MRQYLALLGLKVKDRVTGFQGVVTSVTFDLYGCVQTFVDGEHTADKKERVGHWFDHKRLEAIDSNPVMQQPVWPSELGQERGGFDKPMPSR